MLNCCGRRCLGLLLVVLVFGAAAPDASSGSSIINTFKASTTGHAIASRPGFIQFEVSIVLDAGQSYDSVLFSLTGDISGALGLWPGREDAQQEVTQWEWHYTRGNLVDFGVDRRIAPNVGLTTAPDNVTGPYGFTFNRRIGDGVAAMVGTVTIDLNVFGVYRGGGFLYPPTDGFMGSSGLFDDVAISGGNYTLIPEPGTAIMLGFGLVGVALNRKK